MTRAFVWVFIFTAPLQAMLASHAQAQQDAPAVEAVNDVGDAGAGENGEADSVNRRSTSSSNSDSGLSTGEIIGLILQLLALLGVIVGLVIGAENMAFQIRAGRCASEIERIERQLDEFYGPFQRLLETNFLVHKILKDAQPDTEDFRTLRKLLAGHEFSRNDKSLVDEIMKIDKQLLDLIDSKGGFVEATISISSTDTDATLKQLGIEKRDLLSGGKPIPDDILESKGPVKVDMSKILAKARRHFRIIRLAHERKLKAADEEDVSRFDDFVYPRALNLALEVEIDRLKERQRYLRRQIDRGPRLGPSEPSDN